MSGQATQVDSGAVAAANGVGKAHRWWLEIAYVLAFYLLYSAVRNFMGARVSIDDAIANAVDIVDFQRFLGFSTELSIQRAFLDDEWFIRALNIFYGSAHFVVTIGVMVWLFRFQAHRYVHLRNIIFCTTLLALVGYTLYPLAPPRLMGNGYEFVDTLRVIGGLWSFESGPIEKVSNQYAAMPSLHTAWALWVAFAVMPALKHWYTKALIAVYPMTTVTAIIVTGNHFWMDVVGGAAVFGGGYIIATLTERARAARRVSTSATPRLASSE